MATIVLIEDTPANLELMSYLLEAFGHTVCTAADGDEGLELVCRSPPDLIICDVHLPKLDGYEVARALKGDKNLSAIPLIAVTALAMVGDREKGMAAGFDGYLFKPIEPTTFVADVERFLRAKHRGVLPLTQPNQTSQTWSERPVKRGKILVVDDSPVNRELSRSMLEPMGYEVWLTESADQAYGLACRCKPDLILSDLHMPDEDGYALFNRLQKNPALSSIPFMIFSSSVQGDEDRQAIQRPDVVRFVVRPIEPAVLVEEIAVILARQAGGA